METRRVQQLAHSGDYVWNGDGEFILGVRTIFLRIRGRDARDRGAGGKNNG